MPELTLTDKRIKNLLKDAVTEALEEHRDLFREVVEEDLEDMGMVRAIEAGLKSRDASRKAVRHPG